MDSEVKRWPAVLMLVFSALPLSAQEAAPVAEAADVSSDTAADTVVVTGSRAPRDSAALPFAVSRIDADTLEAAGPQVNLSEALQRVPGIAVNNRNNYAQDLQMSSRGFGARAAFGVRGLRLYSDGIPASAPDGQGQVAHFDLAAAERVEVLRGPFSALYGNSSGGVVALFSREPQDDALWGGVDFGRFGLRQQRVGGEARIGEALGLAAQTAHFEIDGFRAQSHAERQLTSARLAWTGAADRLIVQASDLDQQADDPLGLTREQFNADPYQTAPQARDFDTRKSVRQQQAGLAWQHRLGDGLLRELSFTPYVGQREVTQWLAIPVGTQNNPSHSGGVVDFERAFYGADLRLHLQHGELSLIAGLTHEAQDEDRRGYENFRGETLGVTGTLRRDERNELSSFDQYLQAEWAFAPRWTASLGLRHGETDFDSRDRYLGNGDDSGTVDYEYWNPVAGLVYALTPQWNLYASAARGYETPTFNELAYRADGTQGLSLALDAQTSRQFELGAKWRRTGLRLDAAVFLADTQDELVAISNAGGRSAFGNAGDTRRYGAELGLNWQLHPQWALLTALSWLDASYRDAFLTCAGVPCTTPTQLVPNGKRLPGVAEQSAYAELEWQPRDGLGFAVEGRAVSDLAVNDANSDAAGAHALLALRAQYRVTRGAWSLRTLARIDNLLDREYAGSVIVNESNRRYFEPGAPRSWLLGVNVQRGF